MNLSAITQTLLKHKHNTYLWSLCGWVWRVTLGRKTIAPPPPSSDLKLDPLSVVEKESWHTHTLLKLLFFLVLHLSCCTLCNLHLTHLWNTSVINTRHTHSAVGFTLVGSLGSGGVFGTCLTHHTGAQGQDSNPQFLDYNHRVAQIYLKITSHTSIITANHVFFTHHKTFIKKSRNYGLRISTRTLSSRWLSLWMSVASWDTSVELYLEQRSKCVPVVDSSCPETSFQTPGETSAESRLVFDVRAESCSHVKEQRRSFCCVVIARRG